MDAGSFRFKNYSAHLLYENANLQQLRAAMEALSAEQFLVGPGPGTGFLLVTQSGSSQAQVAADSLVLSTQFFDGYDEHQNSAQRDDYLLRKLDALGAALEHAGIQIFFVGVTEIARSEVGEHGIDSEKAQILRGFLTDRTLLSGADDAFDFTIRVARKLGAHAFFNSQLSWYQMRTQTIALGPSELGRPQTMHPWDGTLDSQGLELRFDFNNKAGLFEGKKLWSWEELRGVVTEGLQTAVAVFPSIVARLAAREG